jgi:glycosyltransferase involved in cell wall biosynthesis
MSSAGEPVRLGLLAASPVYYQEPLYRLLASDRRLDFTAIFASTEGVRPSEGGYGRFVDFGVDMLRGYNSAFLRQADVVSVTVRGGTGTAPFALRDPDVIRAIRRGRYEVLWLHGYNFVTHVLAVTTQRLRRGKVLIREDQNLRRRRPQWKTLVKSLGLRAMFHRAYGLYVGSENREWFCRFGVPAERLFFTPYAVDNDALRSADIELRPVRSLLRAELGITSDSPLILFVGRLIPEKQPDLLLEAFCQVRQEQRCSLAFVGTGPLDEALRTRVERDGIPDVHFPGFRPQPEIARVYTAADIFALVSVHDTWGIAVNEAMNFSLPVVATDTVAASADLLEDGESGFIVRSGDVEMLTRRLRALVGSPELRERLGRRGRESVTEWTYDRAASGVIAAVAAAVGPDRWARAAPDAESASVVAARDTV